MRAYMGALGVLCLLAAGCVNPAVRAKVAEESEKERDLNIRTIGDLTLVANVSVMKVQGVGLVTGLAGTGHCPNGHWRNLLQQYLLKAIGSPGGEIIDSPFNTRVRDLLESPDNALVIVTGHIPPGAHRGDRFDVEITLPEGSKTTSLVGGQLETCVLRVQKAASELSERYANSSTILASQIFGQAKGPLIVGFGDNTDPNELKHARVWQGGVSRTERPYAFVLKGADKSVRNSNELAMRIDQMFQEDPRSKSLRNEYERIRKIGNVADQLNQRTNANGLTQTEMARAINKEAINIRVPFAYRHNHERYVRVARFTPERADDPALPRYRKRLEKMLHDPHDTVRAALRLEAMGRDCIPVLKEALDSENALVRFTAAESLAYLGSSVGVETLSQLARQHPIFAHHACIALANLGETVCRDKLALLMANGEPTVRVSAFHALALIDDTDFRLGGQLVNDTFFLHRITYAPTSMVYFTTSRRAEVILFGPTVSVQPDSTVYVGDFTVRTPNITDECHVMRRNASGEQKRVCSRRLDDVLTALGSLGATYPEVVEFLRKAHEYRKLNAPVATWALPETSLDTLIDVGKDLR